MKTLLEIQLQLNLEEPIRIRGLLRKRKETIREFLIKFFTEWNSEKETIYVESGEIQTEPGKRRSIGDVYRICKYYYPKCTFKMIKDIVIYLFPENQLNEDVIDNFRTSHCNTIEKRVYYIYEGEDTEICNKATVNEYGYTWSEWKSE